VLARAGSLGGDGLVPPEIRDPLGAEGCDDGGM
jgi:hypothetical protein